MLLSVHQPFGKIGKNELIALIFGRERERVGDGYFSRFWKWEIVDRSQSDAVHILPCILYIYVYAGSLNVVLLTFGLYSKC
jgi:hypothetical protein